MTIQEFSAAIKRHENTVRKWMNRKKNPLNVIRYSRRQVRFTMGLFKAFRAGCVTGKAGAK